MSKTIEIDLGVTTVKLNGYPKDFALRELVLSNPVKYALLLKQNGNGTNGHLNGNGNGEFVKETPQQYCARKARNANRFFIQDMFSDYSDGQIHSTEGCEYEIPAFDRKAEKRELLVDQNGVMATVKVSTYKRRVKGMKLVVKNERAQISVKTGYALMEGGIDRISYSPKPFFAGR